MEIEKAMEAKSLLEEIDRLEKLSSFFYISSVTQVRVTIVYNEGSEENIVIYDGTDGKKYTDMCNLLDYITKGYAEAIENLKVEIGRL